MSVRSEVQKYIVEQVDKAATCKLQVDEAAACKMNYHKDLCISRTFLLKFWVKNCGCGLYTRPLI